MQKLKDVIKPKISKYRNIKVKEDGYTFDSKKEYYEYIKIKDMLKDKLISDLTIHPKFKIFINDQFICTYIGDFSFYCDNKFIVEDVKGIKTSVYKLKKKLMKAIKHINIIEV